VNERTQDLCMQITHQKTADIQLCGEGVRNCGLSVRAIQDRTTTVISVQPNSKTLKEPDAPSLGVKRPGCEAKHSPTSSADVKNAWGCTSAPPV